MQQSAKLEPPSPPRHTWLHEALTIAGVDSTDRSRGQLINRVLAALLIFVPVAFIMRYLLRVEGVPMFVISALAIIPMARVLGTATEELAARAGSGIGGLLNATFGNAVELIIAFFALQRGLTEVVKASLTGSIIGNILFVLGLSLFLGGVGREKQEFNRTASSASSSQMAVAVIGLLAPAAFYYTSPGLQRDDFIIEQLSLIVAGVLILSYVAQLIFSLRTHSDLYTENEAEAIHSSNWLVRKSVAVLLGATVLVGFLSEFLVGSLEALRAELGWTELFVGVIVVAIVGNAAEHLTAVTVAMKNKMNLALGIAMGSSLQIALFVAPVLVFIGFFLGGRSQMNLLFNSFELVAITVSVVIVHLITSDGESNWFEGVQLLAVYVILAVAFFLHP